MPDKPVENHAPDTEVLLSLAMIVRDAAATLEPCLKSIRPWVDEMVVVDTGSEDETPRIAADLGARLFQFPWCDDFSAARNESLSHAQGSWVFWMDADDTIDPRNGEQLRRLVEGAHDPAVLGYVMQVHCPGSGNRHDYTAVDQVKLFRNRPELRFEGRIHEQILPAIRRVAGEVAWTDVFVVHSGSDQSAAGRRRKHERDLRILLLDLEERPEHPFVLFNLGMTYADMGRHEEAVQWLRRSIDAAQPTESHLRKAYALLVASLQQLDRQVEAEEACRRGVQLFAADSELLFRQAMLAHNAGRLDEAAALYGQVLAGRPNRYFASMDQGIVGAKARHNLACVYVDMDRPDLAEIECRHILAEEPESLHARQLLAEALRRQQRSAAQREPATIDPAQAITGVVLARNEEHNIVECLKSLRPHVAEILLIDMESTDRTVELARPFVSKVLPHPLLRNFDGARNIAVPEARCEWLWFVDADERIPPATGKLVQELIRSRGDEFAGLTIPFKSYCCGQWMRHCGWWPGYTGPRVLKKGHFQYAENIHGGVKLDGRELVLAADPQLAIDHYGIRSVGHYVDKVNRYSSAQAENLARNGKKWDWRAAIDGMMGELWTCYGKNPGRLDGKHGWVAAWLSGQYRWLAETKLLDFAAAETNAAPGVVPADLDEAIEAMQASLDRCRARNPRLPLGIVWRGEPWNESGYAEETRTFARALAGSSRPLLLIDNASGKQSTLDLAVEDRTLFHTLLRVRRPRHAIAVAHGPAGTLVPDERAAVNVLRTMFETDRIPCSWIPCVEKFDEIWVPSQHVADAFRRSWLAPEKIRLVPGCLDTDVFCPKGEKLSLPEALQDRFVFLGVFDWVPRKGSDVLVESYCQEFGPEDGVGLLLKLTRVHGQSLEEIRGRLDQCLSGLGQSLAQRPDIVFWDRLLTTRRMAALYRSVGAFVLASRGEGWGRPYMEAMACGLPTLGTGASGNLEFMNETNSLLVPATLMEVPEAAQQEFPLFRGHRWFEPDRQALRQRMRQVVNDPELRARLGSQAAADMRSCYSLAAVAEKLETAVQSIESRLLPSQAPLVQPDQVRVVLEGEVFAGHSFSNINEHLCLHLSQDPSLAISLHRIRSQEEQMPHDAHRVRPYIGRSLPGGPQLTIRHSYPPVWPPPERGLWVHIQPWEFGHLPSAWLAPLRDHVTEVWAPSQYVKRVYERSGVPSEKIQVIPWGVDPEVFTPDAVPLLLPTAKTFHFLYVGGTIERKGFDRLLDAYLAEFGPEEDVGLVVKDVTFYRHNTGREQVLTAQKDSRNPEILYLDRPLTPGQLAGLYTACDCFAAPYRGEGFGLPILEAMACGIPVIVPQGGASDDYVCPAAAYLLEGSEHAVEPAIDLCGPLLEIAVRPEDLRQRLREAFAHRQQTQQKGRQAAAHVRTRFLWHETARRMAERIHALTARERLSSPEISAFPATVVTH